jgi:hypothetical protein
MSKGGAKNYFLTWGPKFQVQSIFTPTPPYDSELTPIMSQLLTNRPFYSMCLGQISPVVEILGDEEKMTQPPLRIIWYF